MHDFVDDAFGERVDGQFLVGTERSETPAHAIDFGLPNGLKVILQADNGGYDIARLQPSHEAFDFAGDNDFGSLCLSLAIGDMRRDCLLQVVDVINEDAVQLIELRINVSWYGNIDEEHGPIAASAQKQLAMFTAENRMRSPRRCNHDVGFVAGLIKLLKHNCLAIELVGKLHSAIESAVGYENRCRSMRNKVSSGEFAHLPRPNQVHVLAAQGTKYFLGKFHRNGRDGHRRRTHCSLRTHTLGNGECSRQQRIQIRVHSAYRASYGIGFFHLSENLWLTNHHGIKT